MRLILVEGRSVVGRPADL